MPSRTTVLSYLAVTNEQGARIICVSETCKTVDIIPYISTPSKESENLMANERVYKMAFSRVYPLYVQKAERKGRTQGEVRWMR